jgi:F5/8 type C domain
MRPRRWLSALALALLLAPPPAAAEQVLDGFDDLAGWSVTAAPGASAELAQDAGRSDGALRLDFDLHGGRGWIIARKAFDLTLPANYAFRFWIRGEAPANNLEFKLVDPTGTVWWSDERDFAFPTEWQQITIRTSRLRFAWGATGGEALERVAYIEFAISTGSGGKGSIWLDDLTLEERALTRPGDLQPEVTASTALPDHPPPFAADGDPQTSWRSGAIAEEQWLLLDLRQPREYGGLVIDWDRDDYATAYTVETSNDATDWTPVFTSTTSDGGRDYLYLPESESRYLRLRLTRSTRGRGYAIAEVVVKPIAFSASMTRFFKAVAADAPPGTFPKYLHGHQTYWTVVGMPGDDKEALLNEEGMLEVDERAFSIEPFLYTRGALVTWNDVELTQTLARGYLPMPTVTWRRDPLTLRIAPFAAPDHGAATLYATYTIENHGETTEDATLFLALRPFQVLPPWQSLNVIGGVTPIHAVTLDSPTAWVNGDRAVVSLTPPDGFGAATFEQGLVTNFLTQGRLPLETRAADQFGYAEGAFEYRFSLAPGGRGTVTVAVPFHDSIETIKHARGEGAAGVEELRALTEDEWAHMLDRIDVTVPPEDARMVRVLKSTLAYIQINRDGAALQPGSRTYARAWIRDGAFTSTALLEAGFTEEVRDFIAWFAQYQLADGRIPCCVDLRGADTVPEHDSNGEFIYTVAEYYRFTRDVGFVYAMWPHVVRAVESIAALRAERMTPEYQQPDTEAYYGLLPASISHEGYASHPVHSYWDDFMALRGLRDAADLAAVVGEVELTTGIGALRDSFRRDLYASIAKTMANHHVDYLPASADLGDLDPNSSAIAVSPGGELPHLPRAAVDRTFELYYQQVRQRESGTWSGEAYTPYELRNVDVLIRLGERDRAYEVLRSLLADQRPVAWNEWQEIIWKDATAPRFIGDMPHTWVASAFVRSLRSMFVYEREEDDALVLAAGLPAAWIVGGPGVSARRLPTRYGVLSYSLHAEEPAMLRFTIGGDLSLPRGGIVLRPPLPRPLKAVTVNGKALASFSPDGATIDAFPADVVLEY